jgi:hypothetical protein
MLGHLHQTPGPALFKDVVALLECGQDVQNQSAVLAHRFAVVLARGFLDFALADGATQRFCTRYFVTTTTAKP